MNKIDKIYYAYRLDDIKPKNKILKIYCWIRKKITIKESPSKIFIYCLNTGELNGN